MIKNLDNKIARDIWEKWTSKSLPKEYHLRARALLQIMSTTNSLDELKKKGEPPSLRLHPLRYERRGEFAIDINKASGWRITFKFENSEFVDVKIEDYHEK